MPNKINLIGRIFGRLTVVSESNERNVHGGVVWNCMCACGESRKVISRSLVAGLTTSCGCYNRERVIETHTTHGKSPRSGKTPEYGVWDAMIQRCTNPNHKQYRDYGGRGIKVCERWMSFHYFLSDMGVRPSNNHSIDRFPNNDGNYERLNCRWGTQEQQSRNRSSNVWINYNGEKRILTDWAFLLRARPSAIQRSLKRGKTFDDIYKFYKNKC